MSTTIHLLTALMLCCPCFLSHALAGEEDVQKNEDKVFELGEIVVTEKAPAAESVTTVTERTRKDFQAWSDYSVADALMGIPGGEVTLAPGGLSGNGKQESVIRLRGFETTDVMIMIDGMPLTEPNMKRVDLNQLILDNVAKIKIIKGPSSVLYGPNTAGGVINIVTQEGDEFRTSLDQRFGDYKSFRTIGHNRGIVGPVRYTLGGSYDRSDGFPISRDFEGTPNQPGTLRENSDYERYNLAGRLSADLGKRGTLALAGGYYNFDGGVPYDMIDPFPSTLWRKEWDRWYLNGAGDYAFTDNLGLKAQLFYDSFDNKIATYTDTSFEEIASDGKAISTHDNSLFGYFLNPYWDLGRWSYLRAGIRYQKDDVSIQSNIGDPWRDYGAETFSFSLEDEIQFLEQLRFVAGVGYNLYRPLKSGGSARGPGDDVDSVDFQTGLLYTPWSFLEAHASVGRKTSFPTMRQLYGTDPPNPDLGPQRTTGLDIGGVFSPFSALSLEGTIFFNRVDDMITREGRDFPYRNQDEAEIRGVELRLRGMAGIFEYRASWTGLDHRFTRSSEGMDKIPYVPDSQFETLVVAHIGERVDLRGTWLVTGNRVFYDRGDKKELDGYQLVNLGIMARLGVTELSIQADNIFDDNIEQEDGYPLPGRRIWVGVHVTLRP